MKTWLLVSCLFLAVPVFAQQTAPEISFDSVPDYPKLPAEMNFGEVPGVAVNSKGHVFVFTRSNSAGGPAYAPAEHESSQRQHPDRRSVDGDDRRA